MFSLPLSPTTPATPGVKGRKQRRSFRALQRPGATRSEFVRARWHKAVQQALLLKRLELENDDLERRQSRILKQQSDKAESEARAKWSALLSEEDADDWDTAQIYDALQAGGCSGQG